MSIFLGDLPRLFPRPEQTIAGIGRLLRQGEESCVDILNACLEQVDQWEPKVHAWVVLDREGATEQARALDEELRSGRDRGPLHGITIGIKDIIDVKGLPTSCGAKRWTDRIAENDAVVVAKLREAGAVIMGKTVTTPYAWIDPPPTRNPWNLERTPGGSSSGSAAAVACGMCYGAIGTQTGGSITRPTSFCGVAGMKPMAIFVSKSGVFPFASSLDHVGPLARSVNDLRLIFGAIHERWTILQKEDAGTSPRTTTPRLARFRGFFDHRAQPEMRAALEDSLKAVASRGAVIVELDDPVDFEQILKDHRRVMASEAAHVHSAWLDEFPDDYPTRITELILDGRAIRAVDYLGAKDQQMRDGMQVMEALVRHQVHAVMTPATVGTPPDTTTTGDPAFNSPWSFGGLPTVSFPVGLADDGMPLALQFVGYELHDYDLLSTAEWCEDAIRTNRQ
jgi:Asp-tRNA(Asn)/Glu-tRNA(Gln) amidotransferase A subunit family amidase